MLTLDAVTAKLAAFASLTGLSPAAFEALDADFEPAYRRHRLLLTLVWLKVYPTYEVLGLLVGLHKRNARDVREVLETRDDFPFDGPPEGRRPRGSLAAVMAAFPQVRLVIDSTEQRVYRPGGPHAAEAVLLGQGAGAHAQDPAGGAARRAHRVAQPAGAGLGQRRAAAARERVVGSAGRGRGG